MIRALFGPVQRCRNPVRIAQEKIRGVHQSMIFFLGFHLEAPQRRLRKRIVHRSPFVGIVAHRAVFEVFLNQQHLRAAALKSHNARSAKLPPVQPDIIRPDPRRKPALVKKFAPPLINFQPQLPLLCIPVKVEIPSKPLRTRRLLRNRRSLRGFRPRLSARRRNKRCGKEQSDGR